MSKRHTIDCNCPECLEGVEWIDALRARVKELEAVCAKTPAEWCMEERAAGSGGCGACALCCKEAREGRETVTAVLRVLVRVISNRLTRGEEEVPGEFNQAWQAACAILKEKK